MIQKTYLFETKVLGLSNVGSGKLSFGTLSVLKNKTIKCILPEEVSAATGASLDGADLVADALYGAIMLKLVDMDNKTVVDHIRISTLRKAFQVGGSFDQFHLKNIDWEKSELVIRSAAAYGQGGGTDQNGKVIALQIIYQD